MKDDWLHSPRAGEENLPLPSLTLLFFLEIFKSRAAPGAQLWVGVRLYCGIYIVWRNGKGEMKEWAGNWDGNGNGNGIGKHQRDVGADITMTFDDHTKPSTTMDTDP